VKLYCLDEEYIVPTNGLALKHGGQPAQPGKVTHDVPSIPDRIDYPLRGTGEGGMTGLSRTDLARTDLARSEPARAESDLADHGDDPRPGRSTGTVPSVVHGGDRAVRPPPPDGPNRRDRGGSPPTSGNFTGCCS